MQTFCGKREGLAYAVQDSLPSWLVIGARVERELDDVANIWASAKVTAIRDSCDAVDLQYDDGCDETDVPVDELRQLVSMVVSSEEGDDIACDVTDVEQTLPASSQTEIAVLGTRGAVAAGSKAGSFAAMMGALKSETLRLAEHIGGLHRTVPEEIVRLRAAGAAALQSAVNLRPMTQALNQLIQRPPLALRNEPAFTDLAASASDEKRPTSRREDRNREDFEYMLPVKPKRRSSQKDVTSSTSLSKSSSSPSLGFSQHRPESRGSSQRSSAMFLDTDATASSFAAPAASSALSFLQPAGSPVAKKQMRVSKSSSFLPPISSKSSLSGLPVASHPSMSPEASSRRSGRSTRSLGFSSMGSAF